MAFTPEAAQADVSALRLDRGAGLPQRSALSLQSQLNRQFASMRAAHSADVRRAATGGVAGDVKIDFATVGDLEEEASTLRAQVLRSGLRCAS